MLQDDLILAKDFCSHYNITLSFINSLQEYGLIQMVLIEERPYLHQEELQKLEQVIRLHYDLEINIEGIEAITYLLERVKNMQLEITSLRNKLSLYEKS